jgi:hypothetical protein
MAGSNAADAWGFVSLPLDWQLEITRRGVMRGFENAEDYLGKLPLPWKCPLPWNEVQESFKSKAVKLQAAMGRPLQLRAEGLRGTELEAIGMAEYERVFGYALKDARHWRRLLARTVQRDAGAENWQRLEMYLDDRAFERSTSTREAIRTEFQHRRLDDVIAALENRQRPTADDRANLWDRVFKHFEDSVSEMPENARPERRRLRLSLLSYLVAAFPAGTLCGSEKALRKRFAEKHEQWIANGKSPKAVMDKRPLASGNFRTPDFAADLNLIRDRAILLDGNESLARNMLQDEGKLSEAFRDYYKVDRRTNKSYLPRKVRGAITAEVEMTVPLRRGPHHSRMTGPYVPRDWSAVQPGDWFVADDVTWNQYFKERASDGRWVVLRGECLVMSDLRSAYPLEFLLIPGKYNGEHIRSLALRVHDKVGLPRKGFLFERGVWNSRLVVGDNRSGHPTHWRSAENGLCAHGLQLELRQATTPRAKPIEGLFGLLQERMRCIPGYIGRNEQVEKYEREQEVIARAQRGDVLALNEIPTAPEWRTKIQQVMASYSHDPQNGKMLAGASPAEMWAAGIKDRPLRMLPQNARHILATHRKQVLVRREGIVLTVRGKRLVYYNEHTGAMIGKQVLAYFNIEMPELLTFSDMEGQNFYAAKSVELPAMSATREQLHEVRNLRNAHLARAKAIFGEISPSARSLITRDSDNADAQAFGEFHNAAVIGARAEEQEKASATSKARKAISKLGIDAERLTIKRPRQAAAAAESLQRRLAELRAKEHAQAEETNHE